MHILTSTQLPQGLTNKIGWPWTEATSQLSTITSSIRSLPRISIVTPSYNQGQFIEETIRSVLFQNYPNLEYIIIDGESKDNSEDIIRKYENYLSYWVSEPDKGQTDAINKGFQRSTGEILAWLNSDDLYCADALRTVAEVFSRNPKAMVLSGSCLMVNKERTILGQKGPSKLDPIHFLKGGDVPGQPAIFFRREVLEQIGYLDDQLHYVLDWEYWIRIGLKLPKQSIVQTEQVLAEARIWELAKSPTAGMKGIDERQRVVDKIFKNTEVPKHLRKIHAIAYSSIYWRRTLSQWQHSEHIPALRSFIYSVWLNPHPVINWRRLRRLAVRS